MASKKLSGLTAITSVGDDDLVYVADTADGGSTYSSKRVTKANLFSGFATTAVATALANANETHIDNIATLSGVAKDSTGLGTFTGSTISDASTIKVALQDLETAVEGAQAGSAVADRTKTETDSTDVARYVTFVGDDNGSATAETVYTDAGITYNPSTNTLSVGNLSVAGTTTTVDTVTMQASNAIVFEGATADDFESTLTVIDPTADRTVKLPNQSGCLPVLAADSATAITATPEELNVLDGITSSVSELNILDGVTSTAAELNLLDGVTATTTELNYLDGVTSALQTQIDSKVATGANVNTLVGSTTAQTCPTSNGADNYLFVVVDKSDGSLKVIDKNFVEVE
jgi:hypothetical protein